MVRDYSGQWVGRNDGPNAGTIILELDRLNGSLSGHFYLFENADAVAGTFGHISFPNGLPQHTLTVAVLPFHAGLGRPIDKHELDALFPDFIFPTETQIELSAVDQAIRVKWSSNISTNGQGTLFKGNDRDSSMVEPIDVRDWGAFKEYVGSFGTESLVFRGQSAQWPLRTSFHRTSRSDLIPFIQRDVPQLYNHLSGRLKHLYDLSNPTMNASLWALVQHHGYPTPLLDWTLSPFVAAYFAYQDLSPRQTDGSVRIFILNKARWHQGSNPFYVTHSYPLVQLVEPFSLDNDRALPQQSLMMASNIDDIEDYIKWFELEDGKTYLQAIDLPVSEKSKVLRELRLMGIGAGSLFPGIDGTCRDFKERYFPDG